MYTPFKEIETMQTVNYRPVECNNCKGVLNPHCRLDMRNKLWICPICNTNNKFPPHYANNISETTLPFELTAQNTTIEYELPETSHPKGKLTPILLFVIDTAVPSDELAELKDSL